MDPRDPDTTQRTILSSGPNRPEAQAACLVVIHGEGLGKRVDILDVPIVVGRDHACDLHILHASVSRRHCEIWAENNRYRVRDLGSTNATRLNDRMVEVADLADGDHLTIGESILKFIGDASVEARYHEEVHQLASHDELTGFYNRRQFIEILERELVRAIRNQLPLALAILDVDLFKRINDTHGHQTGDQVLRQVARTIRHNMHTQDVAGRIGGEEFALLIPELSREEALAHMQAMRQAVETITYSHVGISSPITISIGLAQHGTALPDRPSLMRAADKALYRAKQSGRNRVVTA
ncbi:GGDEF domain-containing protein [Xanthomonadaceae bacterium JHOS43]|nr:GGDEF domain-containing protein [Xanthomonadaceae bacterium JHOS43]MCX7563989.1 GGDEF domain-containing protein [Xanthomonadaceae bacterium XH05]